MGAVKNAINFIDDFHCSDLKAWMEIRKFFLKRLTIEEAKVAVKQFNENNFIDLNTNNFIREVKRNNLVKVVDLFYQSVKEVIDYILFGSFNWNSPNIVDTMTQIEKSFYPRLKSEIKEQINKNIFQ